jgi:hypothetical protein
MWPVFNILLRDLKMRRHGTRREVWNKTAQSTRHGLKRSDLRINKKGKIVSLAKQRIAKKKSNLGSLLAKPINKHK